MKYSSLTAYFRERFSARIFLIFSILVIIITSAYSIFFFRYQSRSLTEKTESKGELLASLLAYNARLGVFTENADLLSDPINGIMENREVLSVAVYNAEGRLLALQDRPGSPSPGAGKWNAGIGELLKKNPAVHLRNNENFVFWMRVALKSIATQEDAVYFNAKPANENEQIIGFVRVALDGRLLAKSLQTLLVESVLIGMFFLLIGSVIAYLFAGRVTKPLNQLIEGVNALGMGEDYQKIVVKSGDEIGNLATAFNNMVESLKKREAEKKELEEQLRHSQKMEAIGTLAGGIAHDFNNILTAIIGYGTIIKSSLAEGDKLGTYSDQIVNAGERAATLTQRLLAFSRKQVINPRPVDLNEIVINLEQLLARLIPENVEMRLHLDAVDPFVLADPGQLDQVLINLVTNARDAMPDGGSLTIGTAIVRREAGGDEPRDRDHGEKYVVVTVSDSGTGMTEAVREKIFDPFFTTKEVGKGTGLGLSMLYGIVKQHSGSIEVDSEPGRGSSFRIYLPLVDQITAEQKAKVSPSPRGNQETILVAEDDAAVMGLLQGVLEMSGFNVIGATNGDEAVQQFINHKESIRLALLDVIMPRKNGKQVYEEILRIKPGVKVLFLSGYSSDVIDWKGAAEEGIRMISKPVQPDELLMKILEVLEED